MTAGRPGLVVGAMLLAACSATGSDAPQAIAPGNSGDGNVTTPAAATADGDTATPPVAVFASLDGTWEGTFVGYDVTGVELYRIRVRQTYETVDATTQRVTIRDEMPDGTVITGEGENLARRRADGTLELECIVRKSNGERVAHRGREVLDAAGHHALVWYSEDAGRTETFLESVAGEGGERVYRIKGVGTYGETTILMSGRYVRVDEPRPGSTANREAP